MSYADWCNVVDGGYAEQELYQQHGSKCDCPMCEAHREESDEIADDSSLFETEEGEVFL